MTRNDERKQVDDLLAAERRRMVDRDLRQRGITDEPVLAAMAAVPREEFVPEELRGRAYEDRALRIESGQTISQPYTVAFMCQSAGILTSDRVLEIGTGSGYGAAVLSRLAARVDTIERLPELAATAGRRLRQIGCDNVTVHVGDGSSGLPSHAPFDVIVVTAAAPALPRPLTDQLAEGGRLVIPVDTSSSGQTMMRITRRGNELASEDLGAFVFVPLIGEFGAAEDDASNSDHADSRPRRIGF